MIAAEPNNLRGIVGHLGGAGLRFTVMRHSGQPPQMVFQHACHGRRHANDAVDTSAQRIFSDISAAGCMAVDSNAASVTARRSAFSQPSADCQSDCSDQHHARVMPEYAACSASQTWRPRRSAQLLDAAVAMAPGDRQSQQWRHLAIRGGGGTHGKPQLTPSERPAFEPCRFAVIKSEGDIHFSAVRVPPWQSGSAWPRAWQTRC